jgi:hypothetical protein
LDGVRGGEQNEICNLLDRLVEKSARQWRDDRAGVSRPVRSSNAKRAPSAAPASRRLSRSRSSGRLSSVKSGGGPDARLALVVSYVALLEALLLIGAVVANVL